MENLMTKKSIALISAIAVIVLSLIFIRAFGYERVEPGEIGVLVDNYGKDVTKDYSVVSGRVLTILPSVSLYTLPGSEQRNTEDNAKLYKSSNSIEFTVSPTYSYRIDSTKAVKIVREYSKVLKNGDNLKVIEEKSLVPTLEEIIRETINNTSSEALMAEGGNAEFNNKVYARVKQVFAERGFILLTFSTTLDYSEGVKESLNARNQAKSEVETLDSKINQAKKTTELKEIEAKNTLISNETITKEKLQQELIRKWDGKLPSTYICSEGNKNPMSLILKE